MDGQELIKRRRIALVYIYVLMALVGAYAATITAPVESQSWDRIVNRSVFFLPVAVSLGVMWFCAADARLLGRPLHRLARLGIFVCWPAGVTIYLLWARGLRGVGTLLLHGILLFIICVSAFAAVGLLCFGSAFLD